MGRNSVLQQAPKVAENHGRVEMNMQSSITRNSLHGWKMLLTESWEKSRRCAATSTILLSVGSLLALATFVGTAPLFARDVQPTHEVYFSPKGGCTEAVVTELSRAKKSVLVQAYSF